MSDVFRYGFEFYSADERPSVADMRWALVGADPARPLTTGRFAATDGEDVPYRLWTAAAPRALVLCLHGACDYSGAFDDIGPAFAARGITAMAIDQRGFGATASRGRWSSRHRMIRDAIESIAFLKLRFGAALPVFILGESMGASLAVHTAARAPHLELSGIVLSAPGAISGLWRRLFGSLLARLLGFLFPRTGLVVERLSAWEFTPSAAIRLMGDPLVLRRVRPGMLAGLFSLANSAVAEAQHVHAPVLTMVGSREDVVREACIARLHQSLGGEKQWAAIAGGPHLLLHWKHADHVLANVMAWMDARLTAEGHGV